MALSSPPPPPPPPPPPQQHPPSSSTTTTPTPSPLPTTNSNITRPLFPIPPPTSTTTSSHPNPNFPPPPYPNTSTLIYPLASTGRGYFPKKTNNPLTPTTNASTHLNMYTSRPSIWFQNQRQPVSIMDPGSGQLAQGFGFMGPPHNFQQMVAGPSSSGVVKGVPIAKMGSNQTAIVNTNGFKEARERSRNDSFMIVRDRKVRISEGSSLYALCRSWLRNGLPEETEPQYIDIVKSLPRPLPLAPPDSPSPGKKEEEEEHEEEGGGFVEHLSPQDLLQKHIKRAKRVRSRLREERLRRIARYKTRLSLLLPPIVEHYRNESTAGNGNPS